MGLLHRAFLLVRWDSTQTRDHPYMMVPCLYISEAQTLWMPREVGNHVEARRYSLMDLNSSSMNEPHVTQDSKWFSELIDSKFKYSHWFMALVVVSNQSNGTGITRARLGAHCWRYLIYVTRFVTLSLEFTNRALHVILFIFVIFRCCCWKYANGGQWKYRPLSIARQPVLIWGGEESFMRHE